MSPQVFIVFFGIMRKPRSMHLFNYDTSVPYIIKKKLISLNDEKRHASRDPYFFEDAVFSFRTVSLLVLSLFVELCILFTLLTVMLLTVMTSLLVLLVRFALLLVIFVLVFLLVVMALVTFLKLVKSLVTLFPPIKRYILLKSYTTFSNINEELHITDR